MLNLPTNPSKNGKANTYPYPQETLKSQDTFDEILSEDSFDESPEPQKSYPQSAIATKETPKDPFEELGESEFDHFYQSIDLPSLQGNLRQKSESKQHIDNIYPALGNIDVLRSAYQSVAKNSGSNTAGVDGVKMSDFEKQLDDNLETLAMLIEEQSYTPHPVRRIHIPKANGKSRAISIVTIRDRIVQAALRMLLEPTFEPSFSPYSYAYRANQSTRDAIAHLRQAGKHRPWAIDADIKNYFDTVDQDILLSLIRRKVKDEALLRLIQSFLNSNAMDQSQLVTTEQGIAQGAIISPLLANLYLNELDTFITEGYINNTNPKEAVAYARYADDFIVLCHSKNQAQTLKAAIQGFLGSLKLQLSDEKTKITKLDKGINFLGFGLKRKNTLTTLQVQAIIPEDTRKNFEERINKLCDPKHPNGKLSMNEEQKITSLNRVISSWCHLYKTADNAERNYRKLDKLVYKNSLNWLAQKHHLKLRKARQHYKDGNSLNANGKRLILPSQILKNS